jgi:hypothetical protein
MIINCLYLSYDGFHRPGPGRRFLNLFQRIMTHFIVFKPVVSRNSGSPFPISRCPGQRVPAPLTKVRTNKPKKNPVSGQIRPRAGKNTGLGTIFAIRATVDNYVPYFNTIKRRKKAFFLFTTRMGFPPVRIKITAKSVNYEFEKPSNPGIYRIPYCFLLPQEAGPVQRNRMELQ